MMKKSILVVMLVIAIFLVGCAEQISDEELDAEMEELSESELDAVIEEVESSEDATALA